MKIITTAKSLKLTEAIENFVEQKFLLLQKYIGVEEIFVEVEKETRHHRKCDIFLVKAQLNLPGRLLMAQSEKDDLYKAIVEAKDELKLEIEKYKFKKIDKTRRQQRKAKQETRIE